MESLNARALAMAARARDSGELGDAAGGPGFGVRTS